MIRWPVSDKPVTTASDFLAAFFGPVSAAPVFVNSLANEYGAGGEKSFVGRDALSVDGFVSKWDRDGRGTFFCVGTIKPDARPPEPGKSVRNKDNIAEIVCCHADTDLKNIAIGREAVIAALLSLELPPSVIVWSGRGAHAYWLFNEAIEADPDSVARIEAMNARLSDVVGGDPVKDVSRLMRLPGSRNTKESGSLPVEVVHARFSPRYEVGDVEDWLDRAAPVIARKTKEKAEAGIPAADNPFLAVAAAFGFKPPLDVEQRLSAMSYQGVGDASIHNTQLAVSASLLNAGEDPEEVVAILLDATKAAAGSDGRNWRWDREEKSIRRMCVDWQKKHPAPARKAESLKSDSRPKAQAKQMDRGDSLSEEAEGIREASTGAVVHNLGEERQKREKKQKGPTAAQDAKAGIGAVIADGVVESLRRSGFDIILTEGEIWIYEDGLWRSSSPSDDQWLKALIQEGCETLRCPGDTKAANAAWKVLTESHKLHRRKVPWDAGAIIATADGLLNLVTREVGPFRSDAWCRSKIGVAYDRDARAPIFLRFLEGCFSDRDPQEVAAIIATLQEAFGAMIATRVLMREQRKALFLLGPSRTGKTQLSTIARHLIGTPVAAPSVVDIAGDFGMQMLYGARAWIRDDAVSEQDKIDPARFKAIVTGEIVNVNRKRIDMVDVSFTIPVLLTTNAMPRARDSSDAIYNRSLVLEMTRVVEEDEAVSARVALGLPPSAMLGDEIAAREGPGILNWALDGLDRLRSRGRYDPPPSMLAAIKRFRDDNNPVAAWVVSSVEADPACRVSRKDLLRSFNGWQREEYGAEARTWGGKAFYQAVRTLLPIPHFEEYKGHGGVRSVIGVRLTEAGIRHWEDADTGSLDRSDGINQSHDPAPAKVTLTPRNTEF